MPVLTVEYPAGWHEVHPEPLAERPDESGHRVDRASRGVGGAVAGSDQEELAVPELIARRDGLPVCRPVALQSA